MQASLAVAEGLTPTDSMPRKWDVISGKEFADYVGTLDFTKGVPDVGAPRKCRKSWNLRCVINSNIRVDMLPEAGARKLDPDDLRSTGHVIAEFTNYGHGREVRYNLPGGGAKSYWLIVKDTSLFVYVDDDTLKVASRYDYQYCQDSATHPNNGLAARFRWCPNEVRAQNNDDPAENPSWISCLSGCCVARTAILGLN